MWQRYTVAFAACVALLLPGGALGDVALTRVAPDRVANFSDRLHISVGVAQREPNLCEVYIFGPTVDGVVVSATLVLSNPKGAELLRVPIRVAEQPRREKKLEGAAGAIPQKEWYLSCRVDRELAATATVDVLLDVPARNVGGVYRIVVGDFLQPREGDRPARNGGR